MYMYFKCNFDATKMQFRWNLSSDQIRSTDQKLDHRLIVWLTGQKLDWQIEIRPRSTDWKIKSLIKISNIGSKDQKWNW